jgi:uncharacterized RDD family membrane protein YckC
MTYPQWWERLVAAIIDGVIFAVIYFVIEAIFRGIAVSLIVGGSLFMGQLVMAISVLLYVAAIVVYKLFFEGGKWQATPGKMVFGLKVVADGGGKADTKSVLMRLWPWWIYILVALAWLISLTLAGTLYFVVGIVLLVVAASFFMAPVGRCLHDQTAKLHVIKADKGMVGGK